MELMSLPDEMLATVTKHLYRKNNREIRRMNHRFDKVSKKNKLDKIPFSSIKFTHSTNHGNKSLDAELEPKRRFRLRNLEDHNNGIFKLSQHPNEQMSNVVDRVMKKVRRVDMLTMEFMDVDEMFIEQISKYRIILRLSSLEFSFCYISISAQKLKDFANKMKLSQLIIKSGNFPDKKTINDELMAEFPPFLNLIFTGMRLSNITSLSLQHRVFNNQVHLSLTECKTEITFEDMVQFLKANEMINGNLDFGILKGHPENNYIFNTLIAEFPNTRGLSREEVVIWIRYHFQPKPRQNSVIFCVRHPRQR